MGSSQIYPVFGVPTVVCRTVPLKGDFLSWPVPDRGMGRPGNSRDTWRETRIPAIPRMGVTERQFCFRLCSRSAGRYGIRNIPSKQNLVR